MSSYDLGIIGGMGSEATVAIFDRIVASTVTKSDQDHIKMCILNNSKIPDRTSAILSCNEDPTPYLQESIEDLKAIGCKRFIVSCNTAHYFLKQMKITGLEFISIVDETVNILKSEYHDRNIILLATTGTITSKVYETGEVLIDYPAPSIQNRVMNIITKTKQQMKTKQLADELISIIKDIDGHETSVFVLACTELSLYHQELQQQFDCLDAMDALVRAAIIKSGYKYEMKGN